MNANYPIEKYPCDGSMRMMEKTNYLEFVPNAHGLSVERKVYRHKPTGDLYYKEFGLWKLTYPEYCYDTVTHTKGAMCVIRGH